MAHVLTEPAREIPVVREVEVLVVGGGPAGIGSAVAAARNGARTLLVERYGFLGGMATAGLVRGISGVRIHGKRVVGGIPWELVLRMEALGGAASDAGSRPGVPPDFPVDAEVLKYVANEMVLEAGAEMRLHTLGVDVVTEEDHIRGIIVESKSGRQAILAQVVVDATGDGDVAARAGVPFDKGRPGQGGMQNMTLVMILGGLDTDQLWKEWAGDFDRVCQNERLRRLLTEAHERGEVPVFGGPWVRGSVKGVRPGEMYVNVVRQWGDATNVEDLTRAEIDGRRHVMAFVDFFKAHVPELADCRLVQTGTQVGLRETRRIHGDYTLTLDDVLAGGGFPDVIARGAHGVDIHPPSTAEDQVYTRLEQDYGISYRCLLARGVDNLLVAGRCISATHEALATSRVMGTCMALGQAAGTAAALAVRAGITPRELDVPELRRTLERQHVIL